MKGVEDIEVMGRHWHERSPGDGKGQGTLEKWSILLLGWEHRVAEGMGGVSRHPGEAWTPGRACFLSFRQQQALQNFNQRSAEMEAGFTQMPPEAGVEEGGPGEERRSAGSWWPWSRCEA